MLLIQPPEERFGKPFHPADSCIVLCLNDEIYIALSQDELASGYTSEEKDKIYIIPHRSHKARDELLQE